MTQNEKNLLGGCALWGLGCLGSIVAIAAVAALAYRVFRLIAGV